MIKKIFVIIFLLCADFAIGQPPCTSKPDFSFSQNTCDPLQITFKNETQNTSTFLWNFGNNTTDNINQNPIVNYAVYTNYNVKLVVTQTNGCVDSVEKNIVVNTTFGNNLIVNNDTTICGGTSFKLNAKDTGLAFCWSASAGSINSKAISPVVAPSTNTTYYFNTKITTNNLVTNGDFENFNSGFTSDYFYQPPPRTNQSQYYVGPNPNTWFNPFVACKDHTTGTGNMMMFDGSATANTAMWKQTVSVQKNTDYLFSGWVQSTVAQNPAQIILNINGNKVGTTTTANLTACSWKQFSAIWNSGDNITANLSIIDSNLIVQGNDFAIDDISFAAIIIKTDSVKVDVTNCTVAPTCKGVLQLKGTDIVALPPPHNQYVSSNGFTWETWFNGNWFDDSNNTLDKRNKLIASLDNPNCQDVVLGFGWIGVAPKNSLCFVVDGANGCGNRDNNPCIYKPAAGFQPNTWYHVAGVRDYVNNATLLYFNGKLVDTKTNNHTPLNPQALFGLPVTIFGSLTAGIFDSAFAGKMDEIRIWNTSRTASEIQANYDKCLTGNETGLVAYYHANEKTGTILHDVSINRNNATLGNTSILNKTFFAPVTSPCLLQTFGKPIDTTICFGEKFRKYDMAGVYFDTLTNILGCDSITTIKLTVTSKPFSDSDVINKCGSFIFNGISYTNNAIVNSVIKSKIGCDSIYLKTTINILKSIRDTLPPVTICKNQSYLGYIKTGFWSDTFPLANCDSIRTINLTVNNYYRNTIKITKCYGEKYLNYSQSSIIFDTILSSTSCDTITTTLLTIRPILNPKLPGDTSLCFKDTLSISPGNFFKYKWNNGSIQKQITVKNVGSYSVEVADSFGCKDTAYFSLLPFNPLPKNFLTSPIKKCLGEPFSLENFISYKWNTGETTPTIYLNGLSKYVVTVTDFRGCVGNDSMKVSYLGGYNTASVNAFSPNGDGENETFQPFTGECLKQFSMHIFNRWGQSVFETINVTTGWNGKLQNTGNAAPIGVYYFIINFTNTNGIANKISGSITLLR